jgi:hypothetical protein
MSDTRDCLNCGKSLSVDEMARYPSGGMKKVCLNCNTGRGARKGGAVTTREKTLADLSVVATVPKLTIAPGYGIDASISENALHLIQGEDAVTLSRDEGRLLFTAFGNWANA